MPKPSELLKPRLVSILIAAAITTACAGTLFYVAQGWEAVLIGLLTGIISGAIVFVIGAIYQMDILSKLERYQQLGVRNLLSNRHDRDYYQTVISHANKDVRVLSTTCTKFLDDFLDPKSSDNPLITALQTNPEFSIRILRVTDSPDPRVQEISRTLLQRYPGQFEIRILPADATKFDDTDPDLAYALHSFVILDDQLLASPVLGKFDDEKHSPALHVDMSTTYAKLHDNYFDSLRQNADVETS